MSCSQGVHFQYIGDKVKNYVLPKNKIYVLPKSEIYVLAKRKTELQTNYSTIKLGKSSQQYCYLVLSKLLHCIVHH